MEQPKAYMVVTTSAIESFTTKCNEALALGYIPLGGMAVTTGGNFGTKFYQSFMKDVTQSELLSVVSVGTQASKSRH